MPVEVFSYPAEQATVVSLSNRLAEFVELHLLPRPSLFVAGRARLRNARVAGVIMGAESLLIEGVGEANALIGQRD